MSAASWVQSRLIANNGALGPRCLLPYRSSTVPYSHSNIHSTPKMVVATQAGFGGAMQNRHTTAALKQIGVLFCCV